MITKLAEKLIYREKDIPPMMQERGLSRIPNYEKNNLPHPILATLGAGAGAYAGFKARKYAPLKVLGYGSGGFIGGLAAATPITTQLHGREIAKHPKKEK